MARRRYQPAAPPAATPAAPPEPVEVLPTIEELPDGPDLGEVIGGFEPARGDEVELPPAVEAPAAAPPPAPPAPPAAPPPPAGPRRWRVVECAVSYTTTAGMSRTAPVGSVISDIESPIARDLLRRGFLVEER